MSKTQTKDINEINKFVTNIDLEKLEKLTNDLQDKINSCNWYYKGLASIEVEQVQYIKKILTDLEVFVKGYSLER